jgi:hypothetical protein
MCTPVGVNHEQNEQRIPGHADHMATFFAIGNPIQVIQTKGIIEHAGGQPERDPMFGDVHAILTLVPFKDHRIYSIAVYTRNPLGPWIAEMLEPKSGGSPVSDPCPPVVCNEFQLLRRSPFG